MKRSIYFLAVLLACAAGLAQAADNNPEALRKSINMIRDGRDVMPSPKASRLATGTITERISGTGVTIDGVLLKDGQVGTSSSTQTVGVLTVVTLSTTGNTTIGNATSDVAKVYIPETVGVTNGIAQYQLFRSNGVVRAWGP